MVKYKVGDLVFITDYPKYADPSYFSRQGRSEPDPVGHVGVVRAVDHMEKPTYRIAVGTAYTWWYMSGSFRTPTDVELLAYKLQG